MGKIAVPAPPQAAFENSVDNAARQRDKKQETTRRSEAAASQRIAPLDAAFLSRVYRVTLYFGALLTVCTAVISGSVAWPLSCGAGLLCGLLVLRTQEMFVRRVVRPKSWPTYDGADRKIPVWAIVPGKYILIIAALLLMRRFELLNFAAFAAGCTAAQMVMLSMALSRLMSANKRSIREDYVQPHKVKNSTHA